MPSLPSFFKSKSRPIPPPSTTSYYLTNAVQTLQGGQSALQPIAYPLRIPPTSLIFSLTHPSPQSDPATAFFLECLPDPIGFLLHSSNLIRSSLSLPSSSDSPVNQGGEEGQWRHQLIDLVLEDSGGLAATSGGKIVVSLQWVDNVRKEVHDGSRDMIAATKEFKGVLLHELVHTIQYDGDGTAPGWFIESLADLIRLHAHLDPPHWRKPGQGRRSRGWEEAYDSGARFLDWLSSPPSFSPSTTIPTSTKEISPSGIPFEKLSISGPAPPQATQYPARLPPPLPPTRPSPKERSGPFPNLPQELNRRLKDARWDEGCWVELTGRSLEQLWVEYLDYYGAS